MSPQERALLARIAANPDDDTPRLLYADCLEEGRDPVRAVFIRYQIAAFRGERHERELWRRAWLERSGDDYSLALRGLAEVLLGRALPTDAGVGEDCLSPPGGLNCGAGWPRGGLPRAAEDNTCRSWNAVVREKAEELKRGEYCYTRFRFHRGFVVRLDISAEDFLGSARLAVLTPALRELTVRGAASRLAVLAASPLLAPVEAVRFEGEPFSAGEVRSLLASPYLGQLRRLELPVGAEAAHALAVSPAVSGLEELALRGPLGNAGAAAIAASDHLSALKKLDLAGTGVGDLGAIALAASRGLGRVEDLNLCGNPLHEAGLNALARPTGALRPARVGLTRTGCCPSALGSCPETDALWHRNWDPYVTDPLFLEGAERDAYEHEALRLRVIESIAGRFSWLVYLY